MVTAAIAVFILDMNKAGPPLGLLPRPIPPTSRPNYEKNCGGYPNQYHQDDPPGESFVPAVRSGQRPFRGGGRRRCRRLRYRGRRLGSHGRGRLRYWSRLGYRYWFDNRIEHWRWHRSPGGFRREPRPRVRRCWRTGSWGGTARAGRRDGGSGSGYGREGRNGHGGGPDGGLGWDRPFFSLASLSSPRIRPRAGPFIVDRPHLHLVTGPGYQALQGRDVPRPLYPASWNCPPTSRYWTS